VIAPNARRLIKVGLSYAALAVGVTVGGVVVGATVVAPAVSSAAPYIQHVTDNSAPIIDGATGSMEPARSTADNASVGPSAWERSGKRAAMFRRDIRSLPIARSIPEKGWLYIGVSAAMAVALMIGWRLRVRSFAALTPLIDSTTTLRAAAALPAKLTMGRNSRTPRAVLALAEAGNAPADIARRTGLSLDAVAMCLSLSSFAARQLRPPTA
jgi:hypothetical protein